MRRLVLACLTASLGLAGCGDDDGVPNTCVDGDCAADASVGRDAERPAREDGGDTDAEVSAELDAGSSSDAALDAADGMQSVIIRFKAKLGSQDLVCGQNYTQQGSSDVVATPQDFRFFVQEVRLIRKDNQKEERVLFDVLPPFQRREVALIDFTDAKGSCGGNGGSIVNTAIRGRVPAADYDGIVFVNGVPEELNHQRVETATAPLDDVTLNWNWLGGYRFIVAELLVVASGASHGGDAGHGDAEAPDAGQPDAAAHGGDAGTDAGGHAAAPSEAAFVHVGSSGCAGTPSAGFSCSRAARNEIKLTGFDPVRDQIVADLSAVFKTSDLHTPPQCHGIDALCAPPYAALGVEMSTGKPTLTQQVFRVE